MESPIQHIVSILKAARLKKGLSQRALSLKTGIPQGHISKIEQGLIDLQVSSLIELTRGLDLECMLIPRALVPTVYALQQGKQRQAQKPMYQLEEETEIEDE